MRACTVKLLAAAIGMLGLSGSVLASPVSVANFSFESATTDGLTTTDVPDGTVNINVVGGHGYDALNWTFFRSGGASTETGVVDPDNSVFTNATNNSVTSGVPTGGAGQQSARLHISFFGGVPTITSAASLATIASGTTYTLTVAVGDGLGTVPGGVVLELLAGGTPLAATPVLVTPLIDGAFVDRSITYTVAAGDSAINQPLTIRLSNSNGTTTSDLYFDNVRLDATPEPTSLGLLGVVGLSALRRRRA